MEKSKRQLLKAIGTGSLYLPVSQLYVHGALAKPIQEIGFFKKIYSNKNLAAIFNSYILSHHSSFIDPELPLKAATLTSLYHNDQAIYESLQIAIIESKNTDQSMIHKTYYEQEYMAIVAEKTHELLSKSSNNIVFNEHLSLASNGAHIDQLRQKLPISGQSTVLTDNPVIDPIADMLVSEQPGYASQFLPINQYCPAAINAIEAQSVDLITQYSDLNNCPKMQHKPFMKALLSRLKINGHLIVMQPDIGSHLDSDIATLSHYFTNLQAGLSWQENLRQTPSFQTIKSCERPFTENGLVLKNSHRVFESDLLSNTLLHFHKTA